MRDFAVVEILSRRWSFRLAEPLVVRVRRVRGSVVCAIDEMEVAGVGDTAEAALERMIEDLEASWEACLREDTGEASPALARLRGVLRARIGAAETP